MKILDILTAPWAIVPEKFKEIIEVYQTHMKGEKIDLDVFKSGIKFERENNDQEDLYDVINGVAVIDIQGILSKKLSFFSRFFGGTSTQAIAESIKVALNDPTVRTILLNVDSPGGSVDGTAELAQLIFESREQKPIIAFTDGMMASAAYWIGAAADKIYISSDTTQTGSIGVIATLVDYSQMFEKAGINVTQIVAGKYKNVGSPYKPLSAEDKKIIQNEVDYIYSVFVNTIAKYRNVSAEHVLSVMATSTPPPVFIGKQAIDAGLVDGVSTLDQLLNRLADGDSANMLDSMNDEHKQIETKEEEHMFTLKELKDKHPEIYQAVVDETLGSEAVKEKCTSSFEEGKKSGLAEGKEQGLKEGAETENNRIKDVEAQLMPGHEVLIQELKFDGKTTGPEAAVKVLAAEKKTAADIAAGLEADGIDPVPQSASDPEAGGSKQIEEKREKLIKDYEEKHKVSYKDAVIAVSKEHPELFKNKEK